MHNVFQNQLFEQILDKFPKKSQAVEELSGLLAVGKDAIYRRLRGDTLLAPDEMVQLAQQYHISLDALVYGKTDTVFCSYNAFSKKINNFQAYLESIYNIMAQVKGLPNATIYYTSMEIPVFHYMYYPELICFKQYVWSLTTWNFEHLSNQKFHFDLVSYPSLKMTEDIIRVYNQLSSKELWSLNVIDNTLNQIEYIAATSRFADPEDALLLCDKLTELVQHLRQMAAHGQKFSPNSSPHSKSGAFDLYHNELYSTNNTILVKADTLNMLFTTYCNPNYLASTDERLCEFSTSWMEFIISKSDAISYHSEKSRNWFFNRLERKIKGTRNRVEMDLAEY